MLDYGKRREKAVISLRFYVIFRNVLLLILESGFYIMGRRECRAEFCNTLRGVRMKNRIKIAAAILMTVGVLGAGIFELRTKNNTKAEKNLFAMDTVMTLTAIGSEAEKGIEAAADEIHRLDAMLSTGNEDSLVSQVNANGRGTASEEMQELLQYSRQLYESTVGCFDITIYPFMQLWGFPTGEYHVPEEMELEKARVLLGMDQVQFDEEEDEIVLQKEGMAIDFGGIAKGYTSARVIDIFREYGIEKGIISLGGNVQTLGTRKDGKKWRIAVKDPDDTEQYIGIVEVSDEAVVTSGGYERYFEENGQSYHHIIDPGTGFPAASGLSSVTIVSSDGTLADGLSTALYIMGLHKAEEYWKKYSDQFEAVFVTEDGEIAVTAGLEERFSSEREYTVIR